MTKLHERGVTIDPFTLANDLEQQGELRAAGGKEYLAQLIDVVPTAANIEYHLQIVKEKYLRRHLIEVATEIVREGYEGKADAAELVDAAEARVFEVGQQRGAEGAVRLKGVLWEAMEQIEKRRGGGALVGVPSGFTDIDTLTLGFQKSDLVIIGARPSMGKTAFVLNIAQYAAVEQNIPVLIFSLEMSKDQLVARMLASEAYVDAQRIRSGNLTQQDDANLAKALGLLGPAPIWIDDAPGLTMLDIRARSRRLKAVEDIQLIIVDYLQLIQGPPGSESRLQEISQISRSLKVLAKELGVPVLALSQLSRSLESRTDKRPLLSDLRESGSIEQDADVVMFLYRQEYYDQAYDEQGNPRKTTDGIPLDGLAEVIVSKHRNGPTGSARLHFRKSYTRFENFTARQPG
jgi:replicative DNA helicase